MKALIGNLSVELVVVLILIAVAIAAMAPRWGQLWDRLVALMRTHARVLAPAWRLSSTKHFIDASWWLRRTLLSAGVIGVTWLSVWPVLRDGRLSILDCANVYRSYPEIRLLRPETWMNVANDASHARPGEVLVHLPAFWTFSARAQYWYMNGVILAASMLMLFHVVRRVSGVALLGLGTVLACLTAPSFVENYYTLGKCEPFLTAGAIGVCWVLHQLLNEARALRRWVWLVLVPVGACSALLATTPKESAIVFGGVYAVAWVLLLWASPLSLGQGVRRTAWLSLAVAVGFFTLLGRYLALPRHYDQGGTAVYSFAWDNLRRGMVYLAQYYWQTAPSAIVALLMLVIAAVCVRRGLFSEKMRWNFAWVLVFGMLWLGYVAIYIPWSSPQVRYFLPADVAVRVAIMLTISLAIQRSSYVQKWCGWLQQMLGVIVIVLLTAHSVFVILVGHMSEGRARQRFDVAYDEMFKYVAAHTVRGGTAYFMYDAAHEESRYNTRFGMPLFYGRPDIRCVFPQSEADFTIPGLVAVSHSDLAYNPNRMPVHSHAAKVFNTRIAVRKPFSLVTNISVSVPVWYVDPHAYRGFQYKGKLWLPAFWELQRGNYRFGWTIYAWERGGKRPNLVRNHNFLQGMEFWSEWGRPCDEVNTVKVVGVALRIENPSGELLGVKQHLAAMMTSGTVYRLGATARFVGVPDATKVLGGRVAVHLPPQPDFDVVWLSQDAHWRLVEKTFTNTVSGSAVLLVHMGYGGVAGTAEFTDVVLEPQEP